MKNKVSSLVFWLIALSIGWLGGRVILWGFLSSLIPKSTVWPVGGLEAGSIQNAYIDIQRLLIGILLLIAMSSIGSFFMRQDVLSNISNTVTKSHQWLKLVVTGSCIALTGYMLAFEARLGNYWYRLLDRPEKRIDLGSYLLLVVSELILLTVLGYVVIFEPWTVFLRERLKAISPRKCAIVLSLYRYGVYVILMVSLLGVAAPIPALKCGTLTILVVIGLVLGRANIQKKREKVFA